MLGARLAWVVGLLFLVVHATVARLLPVQWRGPSLNLTPLLVSGAAAAMSDDEDTNTPLMATGIVEASQSTFHASDLHEASLHSLLPGEVPDPAEPPAVFTSPTRVALKRASRSSFNDSSDGESPSPPPPPESEQVDEMTPLKASQGSVAAEAPPPPLLDEDQAASLLLDSVLAASEAKAPEPEAGNLSVDSEDSQVSSPDALFTAVKRADLDMVDKLLKAGTPWDCATPVVRPFPLSVGLTVIV